MEIEHSGHRIVLPGKYTTLLDRFVVHFVRTLEKETPYVIVSGYIAILFGRSRGTEDVDVLIPPLEKARFLTLYQILLLSGYEFLNAEKGDGLYQMLVHGSGIRVAEESQYIPNIELKFLHDDVDRYVLDHRLEVNLAGDRVFISPIEVQIAYKLFLGSEKDLEDASFLWELFSESIDRKLLKSWMEQFGVTGDDAGILV